MNRASVDSGYVLEQYELLRREALASLLPGSGGRGMVLLQSRGLASWLSTLTALTSPPRPMPSPSAPSAMASGRAPAERAELTTVLAEMVLACAHPSEEI